MQKDGYDTDIVLEKSGAVHSSTVMAATGQALTHAIHRMQSLARVG